MRSFMLFALMLLSTTTMAAAVSGNQKPLAIAAITPQDATALKTPDDRMICKTQTELGSNHLHRVCKTQAQINAEHESARQNLNSSCGSVVCGN
jgi:hypothetical protein